MTGETSPESWRITALEGDVADLKKTVADLLAVFSETSAHSVPTPSATPPGAAPQTADPLGEGTPGAFLPLLLADGIVLPWSLRDIGPDQVGDHLAWLSPWVEWLNDLYGVPSAGHHIPACWAEHPGLAAELLTLMYVWHGAFASPGQTSAEAAQDWHNLHLPAVLVRSVQYVRADCLSGQHENHQPVFAPDRHPAQGFGRGRDRLG